MVSVDTHSYATPGPLSLDLLEPLASRHNRVYLHEEEEQSDPDPRYIAALRHILAADFQSGAITRDDLTDVLALVVDKMGSVRKASGSDAEWADPGEPWVEHPDADPRVSLVAWLMHQGANPWAAANPNGDDNWMQYDSTAALMLTYGYVSATEQALRLPQVKLQDLSQLCPCRQSYDKKQLNLMEMAAHIGATRLIKRLHELGQDTGDALWHARDSNTVHTLIKLRARSTGKGVSIKTPLSEHWSSVLPATTVRTMMTALSTSITPEAAVLSAARTNTWAPLRDAIAACPGWQDVKTTVPSGLEMRLPAAMIIKACPGKIEARTAQALRMVARAQPDDREVAPGLTEVSLVRLALFKTVKQMANKTQTALKLSDQAQAMLDKLSAPLTATQALLEDGQAFSVAVSTTPALAKHVAITNLILENRLATPKEFAAAANLKTSSISMAVDLAAKIVSNRTVDEAMAIARIMHARLMDPDLPHAAGFTEVFGVEPPSGSSPIYHHAEAKAGRWLDKMFKENPDRRGDVVYAGTVFTAYLLTHKTLRHTSRPSVDIASWSDRVRKWLDQGLDPGVDTEFARVVMEGSAGHPNKDVHDFTQSLAARVSKLKMENDVVPAQDTIRQGPRF